MPKNKYRVDLSAEERTTLEQLLRRGKAGTRKLTRARILLKAEEGLSDEAIAAALHVGPATVGRTRQRCVEENLGALDEPARPGAQRKLTGKQEAHVIAVACPPAPAGHARWTLWCLPEVSAEVVAAMEEVLDLYEAPDDPQRPKVNFDETSKPLIRETREPLPAAPGRPARYDYEYERNGTRNLFMFVEPPAGWRHIAVTERRTMQDCAHQMQWLVDAVYPRGHGDPGRHGQPQHAQAGLAVETFAPAEARRLLKKLEFHSTPKHGSWLNMAEIDLRILRRQCLARRIPDDAPLQREITAYEDTRNAAKATIVWRFTSTDAREKLHRLYPSTSK